MKKRVLVLLGVMLLSVLLIGCGKKAEEEKSTTLESEHFVLEVDNKENTTGNYKVVLDFKKDAPTCSYVLYENDKEVAKDVKNKAGSQKLNFDMKNKKSGKYKYKVKVVDDLGTEIEKNIEVTVKLQGDENEDTPTSNEEGEQGTIVETPSDPGNNSGNNPGNVEAPPENPSYEEPPSVNYWSPYQVHYNRGDVVVYNGKSYKCIQAHTSLPDWYPTVAASLWSEN